MATNLRVITTNAEIRRQVYDAIKKKESVITNVAKRAVLDFIRDSLSEMMQSPQIQQIVTSESIRGQIGVRDIKVQLRRFLRMFLKHIMPEITWFDSKQSFEINFRLDPNVYDNMMQDPFASFGSGKSYFDVEWLNWLLLAGTRKVVKGFRFAFYKQGRADSETGKFSAKKIQSIIQRSRTGYGLMVRSGQSWNVPASIAGTEKSNIFTKILDSTIINLQGFLEKRMEQYFGG